MPIISFSFSGWCRANIEKAFDTKNHTEIDVSEMPVKELADKLESGKLTIPFAEVYTDAVRAENEIFDFGVDE